MPPDTSTARYRAFISYAHADAAAADWLHRALERYRVPRDLVGRETARGTTPARLIPIFRDREELSASTDLSTEIRAALEASEALIVLCSPRAARSRWVNEEILSFKRLGRDGRIFAIIVDGDPGSSDPDSQCFPAALRFHLGPDGALSDQPTEPIAADARESGDGHENAKLKLIAGLLGVGLDALKRREARAQRRRMAFAYGLAGLFAVLAAASAWFAVVSERQRARAEGNLQAGIEAANTMVFDIVDATRNLVGMRQARLAEALRKTAALLDALAAGQAMPPEGRRSMAAAQIELSRSLLAAGDSTGALDAADKALVTARELYAADPDDPDYGEDLIVALSRAAAVLHVRGDFTTAAQRLTEALDLGEARVAAKPDDLRRRRALVGILENFGDLHETNSDDTNALAMHQRSLDLRRTLLAAEPDNPDYQQDVSIGVDRVGDILMRRGDRKAALAHYEEGLAISQSLADAEPGDANRQHNLGASLSKIGDVLLADADWQGALESYRKALTIFERIAAGDPSSLIYLRSLAATHGRTGDAMAASGDLAGARTAYEKSLTLQKQAFASDPASAQAQRDIAFVHDKLGDIGMAGGDPARALKDYESARVIRERLRKDAPGRTSDRDLVVSINKVASARLALRDFKGAAELMAEAVTLARALHAATPDDLQTERDLIVALAGYGEAQTMAGDLNAATAALTEAADIARARHLADSAEPDAARTYTTVLIRLGDVYAADDKAREAYQTYSQALPILSGLMVRHPDNLVYSGELAGCHTRIGRLWSSREVYDEALSQFIVAREVHLLRAARAPNDPAVQLDLMISHVHVAETHERLGDNAAALDSYRQALAIAEKLAAAQPGNAGMAADAATIRKAVTRLGG